MKFKMYVEKINNDNYHGIAENKHKKIIVLVSKKSTNVFLRDNVKNVVSNITNKIPNKYQEIVDSLTVMVHMYKQ